MGKKYNRFTRLASGETQNSDCAYEVQSGKIITYKVTQSGFLRKKFNHEVFSTQPITRETTIEINMRTQKGSGNCTVVTEDNRRDYSISCEADQFAAEVQEEINRAPS